jgi:hypothetical protein
MLRITSMIRSYTWRNSLSGSGPRLARHTFAKIWCCA